MNATPPEANTEYSRGALASGGASPVRSGAAEAPSQEVPGIVSAGILGGGMLGALLLLVAEFTTLFKVQIAGATTIVKSVSTGSHHSYAMALIALCALVLTVAAWRSANRPALLGLGILGIAALVIALVVDLHDATATGLVLSSGHLLNASSRPSAGFYLETLGAVVLMFTAVWGLVLVGAPRSPRGAGSPDGADRPRSA